MDDLFDSSLNLEETHFREGYDEGFADGLELGFVIGEELGFHRGCVDVWSSAIRLDPTLFFERVRSNVKMMEGLIGGCPVMDPQNNEGVKKSIDELRGKLRVLCRTLKLKCEGYPKRFSCSPVQKRVLVRSRRMMKLTLACCKVYISESRNRTALDSIERAARLFPEAAIINKFEDTTYNRVGYTLVSKLAPEPCALNSAVLAMVKAAFETINLELHHGSHPRLGVVDHICFHPLAHASLEHTARIGKSLAADVGSGLQVPTYLYGAASGKGRTLASIRRELGYFKPNASGNQWEGGLQSETLPLTPDEGPALATRARGVVVIGASPWVDNYNVPVYSTDMAVVRRIAKRVSEKGGGLRGVQAMALTHGDGVVEVACNLLEPSRVGGCEVQAEVERVACEEGLGTGKGYFTDLSEEKIIERYLKVDRL